MTEPQPMHPGREDWDPDAVYLTPDGKPDYIDRNGKGLSLRQWGARRGDDGYCVLAHTEVAGHLVRTMWLGQRARLRWTGGPAIYETYVRCPLDGDDSVTPVEVYDNEAEAMADHLALVMCIAVVRRGEFAPGPGKRPCGCGVGE